MAVDLADRISTARRSSFVGPGFRQLAPKYDALSGEGARIHGGRFNAPESFPVLYLCSTPGCAAAEFLRFAEQQPIGPTGFLPRALYRYDVDLTSVLDLTDEATLGHLEVTSAQLVDDDRALTHHVGEIAHQFGYQAILNASATGVDAVLAVFIENLRTGRLDYELYGTWVTLDDIPTF
jgi:RES domain-containing protein